MPHADTQVLIVGGGPVGLTLALDLGQRGVRCTLVERNECSIQLPKMERCNGRTMEIYRRLGISETIRDAGLPRDAPMDVFLALSLAEPPIAHLPYPSVAGAKADITAHNDGTRLLEPYQLISQYTLEPLLRTLVEALPTVTLRFGWELASFDQTATGVLAHIRNTTGQTATIQAAYLVGCDGGSSTVRKQLGIALQGQGGIRTLRQALFFCPELYESMPIGKGRHYHIAHGPLFPFLILQDSTRHWTVHAAAENDGDMAVLFARSIGMPLEFDMLSVNQWTQHLLCAERYRSGRVFIAGDAAHLLIPTGGLGMNTGIGDADNLGWKLAATLEGWGGPALLDSYEAERRPIALRNIETSAAAMSGRLSWRATYRPEVREHTPAGEAARAEMAHLFDREQRKVTEILGIEAGYQYADSPIVWPEVGERPDPNSVRYVPTTWPGARLPHVWLGEGNALHDRLGRDLTLLRLGATTTSTLALELGVRATGAPLDVCEVADELPRELYGYDLLLVRPDLHVAWRGNRLPEDPAALARLVTGHGNSEAPGG